MDEQMDEQELRRRLVNYHFYHVIPLTPSLKTPGVERNVPSQQKVLRALATIDVSGRRVLDVGCRDGLYSFEAERRGAREVIGIDNDLSRGAVEVLIPWFNSKVRMEALNLFNLTPQTFGLFDVIIFAGVLYHLRFPFLGLKLLYDVLAEGGSLVLETAVLVDDNRHALLHCPASADSPYDPSSVSFFNKKGLVDTVNAFGFTVESLELQDNTSADPSPEAVRIDRIVLVCRRGIAPTLNIGASTLNEYWNAVHRRHSSGADR